MPQAKFETPENIYAVTNSGEYEVTYKQKRCLVASDELESKTVKIIPHTKQQGGILSKLIDLITALAVFF